MIKQEVIEKISKYFKLTQFEAEKIYDDIFSIIIKGVKDDNVTDITNFGEFITKYNNGKNGNGENSNGYKKTVEFLASTNLEEELNQENKENIKPDLETLQNTPMNTENIDSVNGASTLEDEFRKKREALLNKISIHPLQDSAREKKQHERLANEIKREPVIPEPEVSHEVPVEDIKSIDKPVEEITGVNIEDKTAGEISEEPEKTAAPETSEGLSQKSFSDYFTEVKSEEEPELEPSEAENIHELHVIPQSAVELHNEITHTSEQFSEPILERNLVHEETSLAPPLKESLGDSVERVNADNSYYIWYKDSEANVNETQTMSYEYELLYQATKEAEYKSKVRIYVSTFLVFFSIVLVMLIFSPVIYKVFFTPEEQMVQVTEPQDNNGTNQTSTQGTEQEQIKQTQNVVPPSDTANKTVQSEQTPPVQQNHVQTPVQNQEQQKQQQIPPVTQQQTKQQTQQQTPPQQEKQQTPTQTETNIAGITKNTMGWADEKFKVIYIKLDNGKFTIQESAWDSDAKASKRLSAVEGYKIGGLKGTVVKADLGNKGVWFRARFGEFSTIEEARVKAEELRNKEKIRFQALLACFLLFT
jgi:nucleoid DNA-binding protein